MLITPSRGEALLEMSLLDFPAGLGGFDHEQALFPKPLLFVRLHGSSRLTVLNEVAQIFPAQPIFESMGAMKLRENFPGLTIREHPSRLVGRPVCLFIGPDQGDFIRPV